MSADTRSNETDLTVTMLSNATPNTPPKAATETEFLQQRADEARQAASRMVSLIGKNVGHGVDPRTWARTHPWATLGAALVGGFAAASAIPSHDEREKRRARRRRRALRKRIDRHLEKVAFNGNNHDQKPGIVQSVIHELLMIARPALLELLAGVIWRPPGPSEPSANGNGPEMPSESQMPPEPQES